MGEVGCYSLDVYCDDPQHDERAVVWGNTPVQGHWQTEPYVGLSQFTGATRAACRRAAKAAGWRFSRRAPPEGSMTGPRGGTATCPRCVAASPDRKNAGI